MDPPCQRRQNQGGSVSRQEGTVANIGEYFQRQLTVRDKLLYRHFDGGEWRDVTAADRRGAHRALAGGAQSAWPVPR